MVNIMEVNVMGSMFLAVIIALTSVLGVSMVLWWSPQPNGFGGSRDPKDQPMTHREYKQILVREGRLEEKIRRIEQTLETLKPHKT